MCGSALGVSALDPVPVGPVLVVALGLEFVRENNFATGTVKIENLYLLWLVKNAHQPDLVLGLSKIVINATKLHLVVLKASIS